MSLYYSFFILKDQASKSQTFFKNEYNTLVTAKNTFEKIYDSQVAAY